jgi:hypothetical protein
MNSRLERLKVTIGKCEKIEEIFAQQGVRGKEPIRYDDLVAGFNSVVRSGFHFNWNLVFKNPVYSAPKEEQDGREPTYIEIKLSTEEDELIEVNYFPAENIWRIEASAWVRGDGTEATRSLAADCRIGAGETRQIDEDEAMKIIATLTAFYVRQPVG